MIKFWNFHLRVPQPILQDFISNNYNVLVNFNNNVYENSIAILKWSWSVRHWSIELLLNNRETCAEGATENQIDLHVLSWSNNLMFSLLSLEILRKVRWKKSESRKSKSACSKWIRKIKSTWRKIQGCVDVLKAVKRIRGILYQTRRHPSLHSQHWWHQDFHFHNRIYANRWEQGTGPDKKFFWSATPSRFQCNNTGRVQ